MHIDKDVEPPEEDCVPTEEVGGYEGLGVRGEELLPGQLRALTGRWNSSCEQKRADRGRGDSVADFEEFATDPEVALARILMRHPQDQLTTLG